jgi:hypothetical protein
MSSPRRSRPLHCAAVAALAGTLLLLAAAARAQVSTFPDPIAELQASYETWVPHSFGHFPDERLLRLRTTAPPSHLSLPGLPADADVDAWEWLGPNLAWFSLADWAELPGGLRVHPADIVQWNGSGYSKIFDLRACGGNPGLNLDALATRPGLFGGIILLVSFDTTQTFLVNGNPVTVFDEEYITIAPQSCQLGTVAISLAGADRRWDLDGLTASSRWGALFDTLLHVSFDTWVAPAGSPVIGGPGDVLAYRLLGGAWALPDHGSYSGTLPWRELDAVWIREAGLFEDGFESGGTNRWSSTSP